MAETIKMPKNGLTMREGTVAKIHVKKGAAVKKGEPLIEYETDKITGEIESPRDGTVLEIYAQEGDTVEVLAPLLAIGDPGEAVAAEVKTAEAAAEERYEQPAAPVANATAPAALGRKLASPLARKLARDYGLTLDGIPGTGPDGRIVKKDIERALEASKVRATPLAKKIAREKGIDLSTVPGSGVGGRIQKTDVESVQIQPVSAPMAAVRAGGRREKMSAMRRTIAQRLQQSKQTIPHVYFKCEVNAAALLEQKNTISPVMQQKYGQKLSVNDIILAAAAAVLREFPVFGARSDGDEIVYMDAVHLGFAVSLENGLIVPVIRDADKLPLPALAIEAAKLAIKAKAMQLKTEEITGGTFTVSNLGSYGMEEFFAIINPPESAILAVGAAMEKAVVIDGSIAIRPMMTLCLSVDHRIIDGAVAAAFMKRLKETLENPGILLI